MGKDYLPVKRHRGSWDKGHTGHTDLPVKRHRPTGTHSNTVPEGNDYEMVFLIMRLVIRVRSPRRVYVFEYGTQHGMPNSFLLIVSP